ncbi:LysM peptidoglycan-binding domain-containing protein [Enterococcus gallinarum]|uniref:LysM peptidoglycan-binding domain-containing protein n=1 Tax=Enterococcus gallinarum TaxID=1353 RepID=UPI0028919851|nr:LysM peptidoglycan-binding domain-containing protein [Enterococcus gallinarum]MDT2680027.1 LysM peptidoglycan-binding domain-containing protein [Enterococcus gallinarum]MDT2684661.1 LysM peptidoglycan-binding domain-containing protein [Enterococcus gallinarum]
MSNKVLVSLIVGAAAGVVFFTSGNEAQASEADGVWTPRTVEQIKADINKAKDNKYTIVWGDTLSGISQATNITVQKLADINKIANVDLIYAGNTLVFDGNVVTAKNDKGETVAQSVVTPQDKNDANKPVGKQAPAKQAEETAQGTPAPGQSQTNQATNTPGATAGTNDSVSGSNNNQSGTVGSTTGTTAPSNQAETPAQSSKPAGDQPTQPSQPAEKPTTPTQPSTGGEQGGVTTPATSDTTPINMGNSGKVFDSEEAASEYGYAEIANEKSPWYGMRFGSSQLVNKDYELIGTWTVDFTENKPIDWNE